VLFTIAHAVHRRRKRSRFYLFFEGFPPRREIYRYRVVAFRFDEAEALKLADALETKRKAAQGRRSDGWQASPQRSRAPLRL
jgi:hypothetical protein